MNPVLFLYATRDGQTKRICEAMIEVLEASEIRCTLLPITAPDAAAALKNASRIVIGASVRYGHLPATLYDFLGQHRQALETRPNVFFCVNLTARKPGKDTPEGSAYMRTFLKKTPWKPQQLAVFAGALRYSRYTWYDKAMIRFIMWLTGGPTDPNQDVEFTDWERILAFARTLI